MLADAGRSGLRRAIGVTGVRLDVTLTAGAALGGFGVWFGRAGLQLPRIRRRKVDPTGEVAGT